MANVKSGATLAFTVGAAGNFTATTANNAVCASSSGFSSSNKNWCNDLSGGYSPTGAALTGGSIANYLDPGALALTKLWPKANVDPAVLTAVASNLETGTPLSQAEGDAYSRFDLIVTALLDEAYQVSDQVYRNFTKTLAALLAVALALAAAWSLEGANFWSAKEITMAVLVGLLATPLAPIAKDISSALATAVNTMQLIKK